MILGSDMMIPKTACQPIGIPIKLVEADAAITKHNRGSRAVSFCDVREVSPEPASATRYEGSEQVIDAVAL